jgi:BlaI family transcriptional regulator, penicillinase repressor
LPQLELDCLRVLWKAPGASVADVRASLGRPLAYTTVMTVLDRMATKGVVDRRKQGRAYRYSPALDVDSARQEAVSRILRNLFENDREALMQYVARFRVRDTEAAPAARGSRRPAAKARSAAATAETFVPSHIDDSLL